VSNSTLPSPLIGILEERQPEERLRRVWRAVQARREERATSRRGRGQIRLLLAASAAACLFILSIFAWKWSHSQSVALVTPAATVAIPACIEPGGAPREIDFGSGALVNVGAGARLDVLEQSPRTVVLALRRGLTQYDIRPGGARRWRIESGTVTVEVVGTQFSVERSEKSVRVEVQRGRVLVRGQGVPDTVQALDAGHALVVELPVPPSASHATEAAKPVPIESNAMFPRPASNRTDRAQAPAGTPKADDWRIAAARQDWNQAWETLGKDGIARETAHTDDVALLLSLADVARLSGHPGDSLMPLRQIVGGHPEDPRSAMAAFTLGRVLLDSLGNPVQAAFAFEKALALKLPTSLAEDAQARLVEAHKKAGAIAQAQAAAATYRSRYPAGRRRADVDRWSPVE
jgi:transmembrane sensor